MEDHRIVLQVATLLFYDPQQPYQRVQPVLVQDLAIQNHLQPLLTLQNLFQFLVVPEVHSLPEKRDILKRFRDIFVLKGYLKSCFILGIGVVEFQFE